MTNVQEFLRAFCGCLATIKMYPVEHKQTREAMANAFRLLEVILKNMDEFVIGIVENELVFENQIFFELNTMLELLITFTRKKGIEKIYFYRGLKKGEMINFIKFLIDPKDEQSLGNIQDYLNVLGINNIKVSKLTTPVDRKKKQFISRNEQYVTVLQEAKKYLNVLIKDKEGKANLYLELKFVIFNILENLSSAYYEFLLLDSAKNFDPLVPHSVNVALLVLKISSELGFSQEHMIDLGVAAILHDIGKMYICDSGNPAVEDESKTDLMLNPATVGSEFLMRYEAVFGILPVVVAFESNLKYEFPAYEGFDWPRKRHVASMLVALCNYYEMTMRRYALKEDYWPPTVYEKMRNDCEDFFSARLVKRFFQAMGLWPVGLIIEMNDGRKAIVRKQSEYDFARPIIEIVPPKDDKKELVDLYQNKDLEISRILYPHTQGKEYLKYL